MEPGFPQKLLEKISDPTWKYRGQTVDRRELMGKFFYLRPPQVLMLGGSAHCKKLFPHILFLFFTLPLWWVLSSLPYSQGNWGSEKIRLSKYTTHRYRLLSARQANASFD